MKIIIGLLLTAAIAYSNPLYGLIFFIGLIVVSQLDSIHNSINYGSCNYGSDDYDDYDRYSKPKAPIDMYVPDGKGGTKKVKWVK